jgi:CMP-N-acetylneuraminic acid synthetase
MVLTGYNKLDIDPIAVGLIPAKLTSRRLKHKNLADLGGIPLCVHSIRVAKKAAELTELFVSTEADEVAEVAALEQCCIIRRGAELAEPCITNFFVMKHALSKMAEVLGKRPDLIVLLQPTHPFRDPAEIDRAVRFMRRRPDATSLITVTPVSRAVSAVEDNWWQRPENLTRSKGGTRPPLYINLGNFYIFRTSMTLQRDLYFGDRILAFEIARPELDVDINTPWDLILARFVLEHHPDMANLMFRA